MRSYCKLKSRHGWHIICPGKRMDQVLCPKIGKCAGTAIPYTTIACEKFVVSGLIRVTNLSYRKEVTVRFTLDGWETYRDIWADYMSSCSDGKADKFTYRITVPFDFEVNRHMEFAIRYRVLNREFWDNNDRKNYHVQCLEIQP